MKFKKNDQVCQLKGRKKQSVELSSAETLNRMLSKTEEVASVQLYSLTLESTETQEAHVFYALIREGDLNSPEIERLLA